MLDVNKEELRKKYKEGDMNYFFSEARKITDFVLTKNYKMYDREKREDMIQECMENLWKKVIQNKIDPEKNLMSFIWQNSVFRIKEILRKESNRNRIAKMLPYDAEEMEFLRGLESEKYSLVEFARIEESA
jgi:DNA-directed RNA polymerase specialized sigma24 family protein